ncbi:capsid triplex subunit 2 [Testudinid alphaherpesvirus 3]|uniref:Capsid triplex subunit 2 n=1 Tax=Testudinid alphaherpesvirus 3 TaxID=2560801 RepID=A0A0M3MWZ6_9ALPH|nr:capsid triplex subunit 2 [Testudinid alphaherpesvirus 3]AKI81663.1 capsid triplex subunit 2 [Testudinid alphaherpesvirus 3]AKI81766.1 capsid triplex subunit 2 [Testudinid alphaherpesvirus 3]
MSGGVFCQIEIPASIHADDYARLQKCVGFLVFMPVYKSYATLADIDYNSYRRGGAEPTAMTMLAEYRQRFYGVIQSVTYHRMTISMMELGSSSTSYTIKNTGPFEYGNGDRLCFMPPLLGATIQRLELPSIDTILVFPMVIPSDAAREFMCKIMAGMMYNYCTAHEIEVQEKPASLNSIVFRGKRYDITTFHANHAVTERFLKNLFTTLMLGVHEGLYMLLTLMPSLLTRTTTDVFTSQLLHMQSASRLATQYIRPPVDPRPIAEAAAFRDTHWEMLVNFLSLIGKLGDLLDFNSFAKVCLYNNDSNIVRDGEVCRCIRN